MSRKIRSFVVLVAMVALAACSRGGQSTQNQQGAKEGPAASPDSPFIITATIKELMEATVDPAADDLWDAVAVDSSQDGVVEKKPRTEEEWKAVRRRAITLIEATNLLVMEGRHAAPEGTQPAEGELTPAQIDARIAASRPAFIGFAHGLRATAMKALSAIDKKDSDGLFDAGGDIDAACEACHVTYWYPSQKIPTT